MFDAIFPVLFVVAVALLLIKTLFPRKAFHLSPHICPECDPQAFEEPSNEQPQPVS